MDLQKVKGANTVDDLQELGIGNMIVDMGGRGGGLGFRGADVARALDLDEGMLPRSFGAGCNYLGGGLRGSIFPSGFSKAVTGEKAEMLSELAKACVRAYENAENDSGMNDEQDADGDTNWDALGTKKCRAAGVRSAY